MEKNILIIENKRESISQEDIEDILMQYESENEEIYLERENTRIYIFSKENMKKIESIEDFESMETIYPDSSSFGKKEIYEEYATIISKENENAVGELIILFGNNNSDKKIKNVVEREILKMKVKNRKEMDDFDEVANRRLELLKKSQDNLFQISIYFLMNPNKEKYNEEKLIRIKNEYKKIQKEKDDLMRLGDSVPRSGLIYRDLEEDSHAKYRSLQKYTDVSENIKSNLRKIRTIKEKSVSENFLIDSIYEVENNNEVGTLLNISCNYETLKKILSNNFYINSFEKERIKIRINDPEEKTKDEWNPDHFTSSVYFKFKDAHQFPMYLTRPLKEEKNTYQLYEPQAVELYGMQYFFMSRIAYREKPKDNYRSVTHHYEEDNLNNFLEEKYKMEAAKKVWLEHYGEELKEENKQNKNKKNKM